MNKFINMRPQDLAITRHILKKHLSSDTQVWVFGSRAKGTARPFSDLDLIINAHHKALPLNVIQQLRDEFEESDLPYKVDLVDWNTISDHFKALVFNDRIQL